MKRFAKRVSGYLSDDSGQGMVEYILIIGLIVLVIIVALYVFRDAVVNFINKVGSWLDGQSMPG